MIGIRHSRMAVAVAEGESIILRTVKGADGGDRDDSFGRWLGTVYHGDIDMNAEMVHSGHAKPYEGR